MLYRPLSKRGLTLLAFLAGGALLHAGPSTPTINPPTANPPGVQSAAALFNDSFFEPSGRLNPYTSALHATIAFPKPHGEEDPCPMQPMHGNQITAGTQTSICLYINGNFSSAFNVSETVNWTDRINGPVQLFTVFQSSTQVVAFLSLDEGLYTTPEIASISVTESVNNAPGVTSNSETFTVNPALANVASLPSGTVGVLYSQPFFTGGTGPFTVMLTSSAPGLNPTATTGNPLQGTPTSPGPSTITGTVMDTWMNRLPLQESIQISAPVGPPPTTPVQLTTSSLPNGTVGVFYASLVGAAGGNGGPYTFGASGNLPPGLQIATNSGQIQGTPTAKGSFSFTVTATDSAGNSGSGSVSITIVAAPLSVNSATLGNVQVGSPFGGTFTATGGVPPYSFSLSGSVPPGATLSSGGTFGGTATTAGTYSFTVTVTDSAKTTASRNFSVVVTPGPLTIVPSLPAGMAGVAYSGQFSATGGTLPYAWSGSAGGGLSVSPGGAVSGTPTTAGTYSVSVTVTDSQSMKASGTYSVTINPATLKVTSTSLPNGAVSTPYSASLAATGGTPPYSWSASGLPNNLSAAANGAISGTPTVAGPFTVGVTVKDSTGVSASASLSLTIGPAPLKITTTSIPAATLGTPFSAGFAATGGTPPYTWSATGSPAGVTMSPTGTLGGTPSAVGTSSITVTVADSSGVQSSASLSLTVGLPALPNLTFTGLPPSAKPGTQSTVSVTLGAAYPVDVTVNLTLTFAPLSGADDPNIQFSTGGRTTTLVIPAGATVSSSSVGVQTGTVAGTITITTQLLAAGQNITPTPTPTTTIVIAPAAPTITSVTVATNSTGFTVTIDGFDPTRAVTQVIFTFAAASGANLQTSSVTVPATSLFSTWYQSSSSTAYGSQFSFVIPFTVTGNVQSITSVTVTLANPTGTSAAVTASI